MLVQIACLILILISMKWVASWRVFVRATGSTTLASGRLFLCCGLDDTSFFEPLADEAFLFGIWSSIVTRWIVDFCPASNSEFRVEQNDHLSSPGLETVRFFGSGSQKTSFFRIRAECHSMTRHCWVNELDFYWFAPGPMTRLPGTGHFWKIFCGVRAKHRGKARLFSGSLSGYDAFFFGLRARPQFQFRAVGSNSCPLLRDR